MTKIAFITLTPNGVKIAKKLQNHFGGEIITKKGGKVTEQIAELFRQKYVIIGICSTAILIRAVASCLHNKHDEPPVIAIDENCENIIPLLGGHSRASKLGSAVEIAQQCAKLLQARTVITTAGDKKFGIALDNPPNGYCLTNTKNYKSFMSALFEQQTVNVSQNIPWLRDSKLPHDETSALKITVSNKLQKGSNTELIYCPKNIVIGTGCARGADASELIKLIEQQIKALNINPNAIKCIASIDVKSDEMAIHKAAKHFGVDARFFTPEQLEAQASQLENPSDYVFDQVGCHGVSEGAALVGAGEKSQLICPKIKTANTTCAIAQSFDFTPKTYGNKQGELYIIGIGPGQESWRVPEATQMLKAAQDWVGYGLYIDLLGSLGNGKTQHNFALGEEEKRVKFALELAAEGKQVALICSGDAGIYAMAALVYEVLDLDKSLGGVSDAAKRVRIQTAPGISALQGAAARIGAPLGHDFCTISLSDLLTPWEDIKKRINTAAEGDFVISFYNPVSKRRRTQLAYAKDILLKHRPNNCPVILASNIGRENENIRTLNLIDLDINDVDMLTLVMVGSSNSKKFKRGDGKDYVYTPRGYSKKRKQK